MKDMIDSTKESIEWIKPIKGHEQYWITNNGMVWSRKRNIWKKLKIVDDRHLTVNLDNDQPLVHRLVYQHFVGSIPEGYVIHHVDECSTNNLYTNLKAMTQAEHMQIHHKGKKRSQQSKQKMSKAKKGKKHGPMSQEHKRKISESQKGKKRAPMSQEWKRKISEGKKGKPNFKLRGRIPWNKGKKKLHEVKNEN